MRLETALKLRNIAKTQVSSLFHCAWLGSYTAKQLHQEYLDKVRGGTLAGAPTWASAYVSGYYDALMDLLYREKLIHGFKIDGRFYSTHSDRDDYYEKQGMTARQCAEAEKSLSGHFWADSLKPFFVSEGKADA